MRRFLRACTSLLLAALTVVEATPVLAVASPRPLRTRACELRAAEAEPVSLVAVPAARNPAGPNAGIAERSPFVPATLVAPTRPTSAVVAPSLHARRRGEAADVWLRLHRHRARAPDDADPF